MCNTNGVFQAKNVAKSGKIAQTRLVCPFFLLQPMN